MALSRLARAAPFVLGAAAAGAWMRYRRAERPALREVTGEMPPTAPSSPPEVAPTPRRLDRFQRPVRTRFARRPIDIVTIVDDLLGAAR